MQNVLDRWEGGLKTTGGALVPSKSWVFPITSPSMQKEIGDMRELKKWIYLLLSKMSMIKNNHYHKKEYLLPRKLLKFS